MTFSSVFFGTPEFAVPALEALHEVTRVVGVVCQPDRRAGRGLRLQAPAVKVCAERLNLPVFQPLRVRNGELEAWLRAAEVDVAVVAAYGRILPASVLAAPRRGCINLHASLLPEYRGAAPIQWALMDGRTETGISLMHMDEGLDTGPVYAVRRHPIAADVTGGELTQQLATLAADVVRCELLDVLRGNLRPTPQDETRASWAPPLESQHLAIDWNRASRAIFNQVRALSPTPGAFTCAAGRRLKILAARACDGARGAGAVGSVTIGPQRRVTVECGTGSLELGRVQLEGRKPILAWDLVNGRQLETGQILGPASAGPERPDGAPQ